MAVYYGYAGSVEGAPGCFLVIDDEKRQKVAAMMPTDCAGQRRPAHCAVVWDRWFDLSAACYMIATDAGRVEGDSADVI